MPLTSAAARMQVLAVNDRADAMEAVEFLNKRGGNVKFEKIAEPPSEDDWSKKGQLLILKHASCPASLPDLILASSCRPASSVDA